MNLKTNWESIIDFASKQPVEPLKNEFLKTLRDYDFESQIKKNPLAYACIITEKVNHGNDNFETITHDSFINQLTELHNNYFQSLIKSPILALRELKNNQLKKACQTAYDSNQVHKLLNPEFKGFMNQALLENILTKGLSKQEISDELIDEQSNYYLTTKLSLEGIETEFKNYLNELATAIPELRNQINNCLSNASYDNLIKLESEFVRHTISKLVPIQGNARDLDNRAGELKPLEDHAIKLAFLNINQNISQRDALSKFSKNHGFGDNYSHFLNEVTLINELSSYLETFNESRNEINEAVIPSPELIANQVTNAFNPFLKSMLSLKKRGTPLFLHENIDAYEILSQGTDLFKQEFNKSWTQLKGNQGEYYDEINNELINSLKGVVSNLAKLYNFENNSNSFLLELIMEQGALYNSGISNFMVSKISESEGFNFDTSLINQIIQSANEFNSKYYGKKLSETDIKESVINELINSLSSKFITGKKSSINLDELRNNLITLIRQQENPQDYIKTKFKFLPSDFEFTNLTNDEIIDYITKQDDYSDELAKIKFKLFSDSQGFRGINQELELIIDQINQDLSINNYAEIITTLKNYGITNDSLNELSSDYLKLINELTGGLLTGQLNFDSEGADLIKKLNQVKNYKKSKLIDLMSNYTYKNGFSLKGLSSELDNELSNFARLIDDHIDAEISQKLGQRKNDVINELKGIVESKISENQSRIDEVPNDVSIEWLMQKGLMTDYINSKTKNLVSNESINNIADLSIKHAREHLDNLSSDSFIDGYDINQIINPLINELRTGLESIISDYEIKLHDSHSLTVSGINLGNHSIIDTAIKALNIENPKEVNYALKILNNSRSYNQPAIEISFAGINLIPKFNELMAGACNNIINDSITDFDTELINNIFGAGKIDELIELKNQNKPVNELISKVKILDNDEMIKAVLGFYQKKTIEMRDFIENRAEIIKKNSVVKFSEGRETIYYQLLSGLSDYFNDCRGKVINDVYSIIKNNNELLDEQNDSVISQSVINSLTNNNQLLNGLSNELTSVLEETINSSITKIKQGALTTEYLSNQLKNQLSIKSQELILDLCFNKLTANNIDLNSVANEIVDYLTSNGFEYSDTSALIQILKNFKGLTYHSSFNQSLKGINSALNLIPKKVHTKISEYLNNELMNELKNNESLISGLSSIEIYDSRESVNQVIKHFNSQNNNSINLLREKLTRLFNETYDYESSNNLRKSLSLNNFTNDELAVILQKTKIPQLSDDNYNSLNNELRNYFHKTNFWNNFTFRKNYAKQLKENNSFSDELSNLFNDYVYRELRNKSIKVSPQGFDFSNVFSQKANFSIDDEIKALIKRKLSKTLSMIYSTMTSNNDDLIIKTRELLQSIPVQEVLSSNINLGLEIGKLIGNMESLNVVNDELISNINEGSKYNAQIIEQLKKLDSNQSINQGIKIKQEMISGLQEMGIMPQVISKPRNELINDLSQTINEALNNRERINELRKIQEQLEIINSPKPSLKLNLPPGLMPPKLNGPPGVIPKPVNESQVKPRNIVEELLSTIRN